jgi:hypothetical protein
VSEGTVIYQTDRELTNAESIALNQLLALAKKSSGQGSIAASFLLSWWNAGTCGGFNLASLWTVPPPTAASMLTVASAIARLRAFPDALGYGVEFAELERTWRPPRA